MPPDPIDERPSMTIFLSLLVVAVTAVVFVGIPVVIHWFQIVYSFWRSSP